MRVMSMSELQERDRQLRAAGVLRKLVERGFRDRLPALHWDITTRGEITGRVVRPVSAARGRAELHTWADALGFPVEVQAGAVVNLADAAGELDRVQVAIVADLPVTDDAEPEQAARTKVTGKYGPYLDEATAAECGEPWHWVADDDDEDLPEYRVDLMIDAGKVQGQWSTAKVVQQVFFRAVNEDGAVERGQVLTRRLVDEVLKDHPQYDGGGDPESGYAYGELYHRTGDDLAEYVCVLVPQPAQPPSIDARNRGAWRNPHGLGEWQPAGESPSTGSPSTAVDAG